MSLRAKPEVFAPTDGVLSLCRATEARRQRGIDWTGTAGLDVVCELPYRRSQMRSVDVDALGSDAQSVIAKVCVRRPPSLATTDAVTIGGRAYDLTKADEDGRLAWLYLAQLTSAGGVTLVDTKATYDELGIAHETGTRTPVLARTIAWGEDAATSGQLSTLAVTLRACDWAGERAVVLGDQRHSVTKASRAGDWVTLACSEGVADVGG